MWQPVPHLVRQTYHSKNTLKAIEVINKDIDTLVLHHEQHEALLGRIRGSSGERLNFADLEAGGLFVGINEASLLERETNIREAIRVYFEQHRLELGAAIDEAVTAYEAVQQRTRQALVAIGYSDAQPGEADYVHGIPPGLLARNRHVYIARQRMEELQRQQADNAAERQNAEAAQRAADRLALIRQSLASAT